jgi:hypothetical protein
MMEEPPSLSRVPQGRCTAFPRTLHFAADAREGGGQPGNATPAGSSAVPEAGLHWWRARGQHPLRPTIAGGLDCLSASGKISRLRIAPVTAGRSFFPCAKLFLANSHQNSHSPKIKMAANLAASHLADFIGFLAPQVGLEPTTLRLTAECSAIELLRSEWR